MADYDPLELLIFGGESPRNRWDATETWSKNYNKVAHKPVSQMTVDEVLAHQAAKNFGAAGAYQTIPGTLKEFKRQNKLKGNEVYDESLQRKAYNWLLNTKDAFKAFRDAPSDEEAMRLIKGAGTALSEIWASLTDPNSISAQNPRGLSHYAKNGKDRASVSWKDMQKALWNYRNFYKNAPLSKSDKVPLSEPTTELLLPNGQKMQGIPLSALKDEAGQRAVLDKINKQLGRGYEFDKMRDAFTRAIGFKEAVRQQSEQKAKNQALVQGLQENQKSYADYNAQRLATLKAEDSRKWQELVNKANKGDLSAKIGVMLGNTGDAVNNLLTGGKSPEEHNTLNKLTKSGLGAGLAFLATKSAPGRLVEAITQLVPMGISAVNSAFGEHLPEAFNNIAQGTDRYLTRISTGDPLYDIPAAVGGAAAGSAHSIAKAGLGTLPKGALKGLVEGTQSATSRDLLEAMKAERLANVIKTEKRNLAQLGAGTLGGLAGSELVGRYGDEKFAPLAGLLGGAVAGGATNLATKKNKPRTADGLTQKVASEIIDGGLASKIIDNLNDPRYTSHTLEAGAPEAVQHSIMGKRRAFEERAGRGSDSEHNTELTAKIQEDIKNLIGAEMFGDRPMRDYQDPNFQLQKIKEVRDIEEQIHNENNLAADEAYKGAMEGLYADIPANIRGGIIDSISDPVIMREFERLQTAADQERNTRAANRDAWYRSYDNIYNYHAEPFITSRAQALQTSPLIRPQDARAWAEDWLKNSPQAAQVRDTIRRRMPNDMRNGRQHPQTPDYDPDSVQVGSLPNGFIANARRQAEAQLQPLIDMAKTNQAYGEAGKETTLSVAVGEFVKRQKHEPTANKDVRNILEQWRKLVYNQDTNAGEFRGRPINNLDTYLTRFNDFKNNLLEKNISTIPGTNTHIENKAAPAEAVKIMEGFNDEMFMRNGIDNNYTQALGTGGNYATKLKGIYREKKEFQRGDESASNLDTLIDNYLTRFTTQTKNGRITSDSLNNLIANIKQRDPELAKDFARILYTRRVSPAFKDFPDLDNIKTDKIHILPEMLGADFGGQNVPANYVSTQTLLKALDEAQGNTNASTTYDKAIRNISANNAILSNLTQSASSVRNGIAGVENLLGSPSTSLLLAALKKLHLNRKEERISKQVLKLLNDPKNFRENYIELMGATPRNSTQLLNLLYNIYGSALGSSTASPERPEYEN